MDIPLLQTKLYVPPGRPEWILRRRLIRRLHEGRQRKLTLVSAPAGFGKTTLVCEWIADLGAPPSIHKPESEIQNPRVAWLSLSAEDDELTRFLVYVIAALRTAEPDLGRDALNALQSPQPPATEIVLTNLINEIASAPGRLLLVIDDYHLIEARAIHDALAFLLEHLPPAMHLVIATREDPPLPLARLRAQGQLTELRVADLRFTLDETAEFLNRAMGLALATEDVAALETRTEGWIAGLQLAALALRGEEAAGFIQSFTGSHRFVLDYLVEEVLHQQPEGVQTFLLCTSILDRMCADLCDAVLAGCAETEGQRSQATLEHLARANLFIVSLDSERRWYRYHHLFAGFLRQRLRQRAASGAMEQREAALHVRASQWYEDHGLMPEAFQHAAAADDFERAERLIGSKEMPVHFRGTVNRIRHWLASLPKAVRDARPALWVKSATLALVAGQTAGVEEHLQAAERALQSAGRDDRTRDLIGQIACARATLALTHYQPETMLAQARRALEHLHPENLPFLFTAHWALASAYHIQGERAAALPAYEDAIAISQKSGDGFSMVLATSDLGQIQELENQLHRAAETYRRVLQMMGDQPQPNINEVHLGLARIHYEWNELDAAEDHGQRSLKLARLYDRAIDRFVISEVFLARLKLARGEGAGAIAALAEIERTVRQHNFAQRMPEVAAAQVHALLALGKLAEAARAAAPHDLPRSQARVFLAQGNTGAALGTLEPWRRQAEARGWADERLKAMVLQAVALRAHGEEDSAVHVLSEALALAEPGGFIRTFVDEGPPMAQLLAGAAARGVMPGYVERLLDAFEGAQASPPPHPLVEPLSPRELEVLQLIAQGLTNREIGERLFIALDTVKGHNRRIYGKLNVNRRTEAVARARDLGLL